MKGWSEKHNVGAVKCPPPSLIRPGLSSVQVFLKGVVNPGLFKEGEVVVISKRRVYTQLVSDPLWEEAEIPAAYLENDNGEDDSGEEAGVAGDGGHSGTN